MDVFCGIDWAEDHHDIALADRDGKLPTRLLTTAQPAVSTPGAASETPPCP